MTQRLPDDVKLPTLTLDEYLRELEKIEAPERIRFLTSLKPGDPVSYTAPTGQLELWQQHTIISGPHKVEGQLIYITEHRGQIFPTPIGLLSPARLDQTYDVPQDLF